MKEYPLVSILLPYYNDEQFLAKSISSILKQTYKHFELILINHASTDSSRAIAHSFSDSRIIHLDMVTNSGAGGGLIFKEFMHFAQGEYIKPFCADDEMNPECIEKLVEHLECRTDIDFCFGDVEYIDTNSKSLHDTWFNTREGFSLRNSEEDLLLLYFDKGLSPLPYIGSFVRRNVLEEIFLDNTLIMMFDMSIWFQLLLNGKKLSYLTKCVAKYRIHPGQVSGMEQMSIALTRSYFESCFFRCCLASRCKDITIIKSLLKSSKYIEKLVFVEDIPFVVLEYCFSTWRDQASYILLNQLMEDDAIRTRIESRFSFTIKSFRLLYSLQDRVKDGPVNEIKQDLSFRNKICNGFKKYKAKIFSTSAYDLTYKQLLFLFVRRIKVKYEYLKSKKKKYSM